MVVVRKEPRYFEFGLCIVRNDILVFTSLHSDQFLARVLFYVVVQTSCMKLNG